MRKCYHVFERTAGKIKLLMRVTAFSLTEKTTLKCLKALKVIEISCFLFIYFLIIDHIHFDIRSLFRFKYVFNANLTILVITGDMYSIKNVLLFRKKSVTSHIC